jgi:uncharacterized cofD-like protein
MPTEHRGGEGKRGITTKQRGSRRAGFMSLAHIQALFQTQTQRGFPSIVTNIGGGNATPVLVKGFVEGLERGEFFGFEPFSVTTAADSGGFTGELRESYGSFAIGDLIRTTAAHYVEGKNPKLRKVLMKQFPSNHPNPKYAGKSIGDFYLMILERELGEGRVAQTFIRLLEAEESNSGLREVLSKRFPPDDPLYPNASLGHLYYLILESEAARGQAIREYTSSLNMRGMAFPVSLANYHLCAKLEDGRVLDREHLIDRRDPADLARIVDPVWLEPDPVPPYGLAVETIARSDVAVLAFGDFYTSLIQILLVDWVVDAISMAKEIVFCIPLMTKAAETRGFTALDYVRVLSRYGIGRTKLQVQVNVGPVSPKVSMRYEKQGAEPVRFDESIRREMLKYCSTIVEGDFIDRVALEKNGEVRHNPMAITRSIVSHTALGNARQEAGLLVQ